MEVKMDKKLQQYLEIVEGYLKALPIEERIDIIKEIKGEMLDLQTHEKLSAKQIIERFGNPKELAKAYIGDALIKNSFSIKRFGILCSFYCLVGLSGMIILPITSSLSFAFLFAGIISPICGILKLILSVFGYDTPFIMFQFGEFTASPFQAFILSIICGILFYVLSRLFWKLTLKYIKIVSQKNMKLKAI